jgi:uncharacterized protein
MNTIAGAGSLITFPTLLALGFPPVLANVSNNIGLVPGNVSGIVAYRVELKGQRDRLIRLGPASLMGGVTGAALLLALPGTVFRSAVPFLILLAAALMVAQPRLARRLADRRDGAEHGGPLLFISVFLAGVYGGYFGAAQGVLLVAVLSVLIEDHLQRLNATKNTLVLGVNGIAAAVFVIATHVDWTVAGLIALGSVAGGVVGGKIGRRLPAAVLRWTIVLVGTAVGILLIVEWR